ncbi:phosphoribosylglycinamide formyltransferase [Pantoea sp. Mhis]|uniref:phosphoribosylglycinamide formyltransferase n=1 Tax=Pantoea sp. Mhis TaxID=2576759 RepID=UPI00135AA565|nr:phosphoribosylglycinamide formyltransferase [Pantoea sp. Mhis]MXP56591.1 phosphoribosylglycinamide formyltransferase [Pantoea sp. Mhis]
MKKLVVLISGNGTNLKSILVACENKYINGNVVAVFSNTPKAYGLIYAIRANVPYHILTIKDFVNRKKFDQQLIKKIDFYSPDLVVLAGYMLILSKEFVEHYYKRLINIHPSLLPKYPGLYTHRQVLQNGDNEHGATVHFVTDKLDSGPIILQTRIPILTGDTEIEIIKKVQHKEHIIYPLVIKWFTEERLKMHKNKIWLDDLIIPITGLVI